MQLQMYKYTNVPVPCDSLLHRGHFIFTAKNYLFIENFIHRSVMTRSLWGS